MRTELLFVAVAIGLVTIASSGTLADHVIWMDMAGGSHGGPGSLGAPYTEFRGMATVSPANVWAVGVTHGPSGDQPRIERWDGSLWTVTAVASTQAQADVLNAVAATSAADAWAVGYSAGIDGLQEGTLIVHWDGHSWSRVPSPNPTQEWNELDAVIALSPANAWAVGYSKRDSSPAEVLVEHWNGLSWDSVSAPSPASGWNQLAGIAYRRPNDIWAAGWQQQSDSTSSSLLEHYDGAHWSLAPTEGSQAFRAMAGAGGALWATGGSTIHLAGNGWLRDHTPIEAGQGEAWSASASAAGDAWLAGSANGRGGERGLLEHWDGVSWKPVALPATPLANRLTAVLSVSSQDVWIAGTFLNGQPHTLLEHWDGRQWSVVRSPD